MACRLWTQGFLVRKEVARQRTNVGSSFPLRAHSGHTVVWDTRPACWVSVPVRFASPSCAWRRCLTLEGSPPERLKDRWSTELPKLNADSTSNLGIARGPGSPHCSEARTVGMKELPWWQGSRHQVAAELCGRMAVLQRSTWKDTGCVSHPGLVSHPGACRLRPFPLYLPS